MAEPPIPSTTPEVEALILSLYQPNPPDVISRTQSLLSRLQASPHAWIMAFDLLSRPDDKVKFFGALTIIIKLNTESLSLSDHDANELLVNLIGWYLDSIRLGNGPIVVRKLSSALATFFLHFHRLWRRFVPHLAYCFATGQPCHPEALDASCDIDSLFEGASPIQLQATCWVVTNILEDVNKFDLNSASNMGLYDAILENVSPAVTLMTRGLSPGINFHQAHEDSIKCLQAWASFAQRNSSRDVGLARSLGGLISLTIITLLDDELYDAAVELVIDLLSNCSTMLGDIHYQALSGLFDSPWSQKRYEALIQGDFDFDSVRFGQLLLAFGDARVEKLMQADDEQSRHLLLKLCGLLAAQGYPVAEDKIFVPALEFWSTFAETMTDCMYSGDTSTGSWVAPGLSLVLQAVSHVWQRVAYPPPDEFASWDSSERVGFHDARKDVIDFLQSVYPLAGPQLVPTFTDLMLQALSTSSWSQLEAAAYCLGGLADCIAEDSRCDGALRTIFTSSLFSTLHPGATDMPSRVRQTCVSLIEHYTEYFERNLTFLPDALNLLFAVVGDQPMATAAAKSIFRLCSSCRGHLHPEVGAFLSQFEMLVARDKLDCVGSEKIVGGIASVIQAIPDSPHRHAACAKLLSFIEGDVRRAIDLSHSSSSGTVACLVEPCCSYASPDESPALHTVLKALRCLASMGRGLQAMDDSPLNLDALPESLDDASAAQLSQLQHQIIALLIQAEEKFNTSGEVIELICAVLRSGFSEVEPGPFVLPPLEVGQFMMRHGVGTPRIGLLVSLACSFVSSLEHNTVSNHEEILTTLLLWVVRLLQQLQDAENDPELSQTGIEFVSRLISKRPEILLRVEPNSAAEFFFLFTLRVLDGKEPLPKASSAEFWAIFISLRNGPEGTETAITQAMATLGPLLSHSLMRNIGGSASRSELDKLSEPLKKLVTRYPMAKHWLEAALADSSFPSPKVTSEEKSMFVRKIVSLRGARATNQMVREFWLSARGSNFAYAS